MKKPLLNISAYHPKVGKFLDLQYVSIKQAKYFNPGLINFRIKGEVKK